MKVLVVGGSGTVGSLILPIMAQKHELRIFDMRPPQVGNFDYYEGDVTIYDDFVEALAGIDALVYMAMGSLNWTETDGITSAFDVNVKGVHLALRAAHQRGIKQAVYTSSMSVYRETLILRHFSDEDLTPDEIDLYGFTKRLGEEVCQNACRLWGMNVNALRLCHPTAEEKWLAETMLGKATIATTANDVAQSILAGLEFSGGFQAFTISGDYDYKIMNMSKAKRLLGWEPVARPTRISDDE